MALPRKATIRCCSVIGAGVAVASAVAALAVARGAATADNKAAPARVAAGHGAAGVWVAAAEGVEGEAAPATGASRVTIRAASTNHPGLIAGRDLDGPITARDQLSSRSSLYDCALIEQSAGRLCAVDR